MSNILERNKDGKKLNGHFLSIVWPNDKYLGRIRNKKDETKNEDDEKSTTERIHAGQVKLRLRNEQTQTLEHLSAVTVAHPCSETP